MDWYQTHLSLKIHSRRSESSSPSLHADRQEILRYLLVHPMTRLQTCDFGDRPIPIGPFEEPLVRESPIRCGMDLPSSLGRRERRADCPVLPDHVHAQGRGPCQVTALWRRSISSGHQQPLPSFHVPPTQARHISSASYYSEATAAVIAANSPHVPIANVACQCSRRQVTANTAHSPSYIVRSDEVNSPVTQPRAARRHPRSDGGSTRIPVIGARRASKQGKRQQVSRIADVGQKTGARGTGGSRPIVRKGGILRAMRPKTSTALRHDWGASPFTALDRRKHGDLRSHRCSTNKVSPYHAAVTRRERVEWLA